MRYALQYIRRYCNDEESIFRELKSDTRMEVIDEAIEIILDEITDGSCTFNGFESDVEIVESVKIIEFKLVENLSPIETSDKIRDEYEQRRQDHIKRLKRNIEHRERQRYEALKKKFEGEDK